MNIVILGASRGLGLVLSEHVLKARHNLLAGLRGAPPPRMAALLNSYPHLTCADVDVTHEEGMEASAHLCRQSLGQVDVLIYMAGVIKPSDRERPLHEMSLSDLRETFETNTFGAVSAVKHYYPLMKRDGRGAVLLITSEGCDISNAGSWIPAYALSKCAETKIASIMNASVSDVKFYAIHPGRMNTDMGRETQQIEPEETAAGLLHLIESGELHRKGTWYMDYKGRDMLQPV